MKPLTLAIASCIAALALMGQAPLSPSSSPSQVGLGRPPLQITPPLSDEEAALIGRIGQLIKGLGQEASEKDLAEIRRAVESHFDYLSNRSDERVEEMKRHLAKIVDAADRRKAARSELVDLEMRRILSENRSLQFYPDVLSILKTPGVPRAAQPRSPAPRGD